MSRVPRYLVVVGVITLAAPALAWHDEGHTYAARAAVVMLPGDVPAFFREGVETIQHCALDPDVNRMKGLPQLNAANAPEHYLDAELLQGRDWPETREGFIALCHELGETPGKVGYLPYAIAERTQALAVAFAEHRKDPGNPHVRMRCLVIAGELSHFTADLCMPLHTTVDHDGRVPPPAPGSDEPVGEKEHKGIHARIDALPTKMTYEELYPAEWEGVPMEQRSLRVKMEALMLAIKAHFDASHALVDRTYELEAGIPALPDLTLTDPAVRDFTKERMRASAEFTATIFLTAWHASADLELPAWLDRSVFDEHFDPAAIPPQPAP